MSIVPVKRALISVSDKTGLQAFAQALVTLDIEIVSTGGTSQVLQEAGIPHQLVETMTGYPEILAHRVKTLHPHIHGGILGRRDIDQQEAIRHGIHWIDLVVVNFYPFMILSRERSEQEVMESIDIGGPAMVRAAAKNVAWVGVVVNPVDYDAVLTELRQAGGLSAEKRKELATKAFAATQHYDAMIHAYLQRQVVCEEAPQQWVLHLEKKATLRYGENPHQKAYAYQLMQQSSPLLSADQHQGKTMSYNNMLDGEAAWCCVNEWAVPTCVIVKHGNPCGVASAEQIEEAYEKAYQADPSSAFGGIVALNRPCTLALATALIHRFVEVILAPAYAAEALTMLAVKPNVRVLAVPVLSSSPAWEMKWVHGGVLWQERDISMVRADAFHIPTQAQPTVADIETMLFVWPALKHTKSNAILIAKDHATVGIGAGQVSRIDAVHMALRKAGQNSNGAVLASDAFFPFRDSIDELAQAGIRAIIQPGGSKRDEEVITACDEYGIAMALTGKRCFRH